MKCQETLAQAVARTKGKESAAAKALTEFEARRARGEDVIIFPFRGKWLVGSAEELSRQSEQQRLAPGQARMSQRASDADRPSATGNGRRAVGGKKKPEP